jgi:hypothetical protein
MSSAEIHHEMHAVYSQNTVQEEILRQCSKMSKQMFAMKSEVVIHM